MRTRMFASPANLWIRLAVGLGLLTLICLQCTRPSDVVSDRSLVSPAFAAEPRAKAAGPGIEKLEELAKTDQIALLELCLANYDQTITDYSCRLIKRERIGRKLGRPQEIDVKFLGEPFSVAMMWTKNAPISDRALYVEGKHDGNMLVKPKGLLSLVGTVRRKPDSKEVMANTLRPITLFGFQRALESLVEVYEVAEKRGELEARYVGLRDVAGRQAVVLERVLPMRDDYPAAKTRIYLDTEMLVPICVEAWDWDGKLTSRYIFKDIRLNIGLSPEDFEPKLFGL